MEAKEKTEQEMDSLMEKILEWQRVEGKQRAVIVYMMDDETETAVIREVGKRGDLKDLYGMAMEREESVLHKVFIESMDALEDWLKRKLLKN